MWKSWGEESKENLRIHRNKKQTSNIQTTKTKTNNKNKQTKNKKQTSKNKKQTSKNTKKTNNKIIYLSKFCGFFATLFLFVLSRVGGLDYCICIRLPICENQPRRHFLP